MFQTELANLLRRRADKSDARRFAGCGERQAFREKTVAGPDRFRAALAGGGENFIDAQIAVGGFITAERDRHVRFFNVARVAIGIGVNGNAFHAEAFQGANRAAGNFATVGDQNGAEHGYLLP